MKLKRTLTISALSITALLSSCGDKDDHAGHDHAEGKHDEHAEGEHDDHEGHDHAKGEHEEDHSKCGVQVGPNGGRLIKEVAEFNLNSDNKMTLTFVAEPAEGTQIVVLSEGTPVELSKEGKVYTSTEAAKLPAEVHVSIKEATGKKNVEKFTVEAGKCTKCGNKKLACTCGNHDHGDHDDHEGHDH